jgi:hypothetical protein
MARDLRTEPAAAFPLRPKRACHDLDRRGGDAMELD